MKHHLTKHTIISMFSSIKNVNKNEPKPLLKLNQIIQSAAAHLKKIQFQTILEYIGIKENKTKTKR